MVYEIHQRIAIVKWYLISESADEVIGRFAFTFPDSPLPVASTIRRIFNCFDKTGCIVNCKNCSGTVNNARSVSEARLEKEETVCAFVEANEPCTSQVISSEVDIPARTVRNILKRNKYNCYRFQKSQEIFPDDKFRRMEFCAIIRERVEQNPDFSKKIIFTDESTFFLHNKHNASNVRYWSTENKHLSIPSKSQYPEKLNVWAGILNNSILGPFFIEGTLTSDKYLRLLERDVFPAVRALNVNWDETWFQQDGCPAHNAVIVQTFLNENFPGRLISTRGTIPWPPRSPDLTPLDFFSGVISRIQFMAIIALRTLKVYGERF